MTEVEVCNNALYKNHSLDDISAAVTTPAAATDGTIATATSAGIATTICKRFFKGARQQMLRLANWTCIQKRVPLANTARANSTAYLVGDLIVALHGSVSAVYKCTTAGTSHSAAPTFPASGTIAEGSGTVVWTFLYDLVQAVPSVNLTGYEHVFPLPLDYINQVDVCDGSGRKIDFVLEAGAVYCDLAEPVLIYIPDETDVNKWDPLLLESVTMQLASMIAFPITGSHENEVAFYKGALAIVDIAMRRSARESRQGRLAAEPWMEGLYSTDGKQANSQTSAQ